MLKLLLLLAGLATASALCPNGCSGHGTCLEYDMCTCFQNWQGNDCSEQTCPFESAFTTTPQGDLNMDGDRYDNSQKLLVKLAGGAANQGTIVENDDVLTLNKDINTNEIIVGDAVRIGDETFVIDSVITQSTFSLDHDRFTGITTEVNVFKYLENIQSPKGTWESWAGDFNAEDDEGHYYMECSNRGLCDRKTGTCECFDGYSGASCQRQRCPNDCSGHGTCETVAELTSSAAPKLATFTVYAATAGSASVTPSADPNTLLSVGDTIRLGSSTGQDLKVTGMTAAAPYTITVYPTSALSHEFGALMYIVPKYDLWDADKDRSCTCDSPYTGGDCSLRACPVGDDPLTVYTTPSVVKVDGVTSFLQRNEKQNIYLNTQRGALSGTFTLTFTDAFGQKWTTEAIYINERLSSKAYVDTTTKSVVTFSPSLPYGELEAGDFLMIGDERQEVLTTYPIVSTTQHRPVKLGGVVDSVAVANVFAVSSTNVYCFRAGPAKGIKAALEALPNSIVPSVNAEAFNTGTLIGHHLGGVVSASGMTTIKNVLGDYDQQNSADAAAKGRKVTYLNTRGGIAPYDTIRVVATGGKSQFMQLRNVDVYPVDGRLEQIYGKGTLTTQTGTATTDAAASAGNLGIGAGTIGAIYRAGGHHVRVTFNSNSGDLPEMECDESGLYSVFLREFTGTVAASDPRKVVARLHGDLQFNADTAHSVPQRGYLTGKAAAEYGHGSNVMFKGDVADLKLMAGMRIKLGDQVRTVATNIDSTSATGDASFYVDEDFVENAVSETKDHVFYLFHNYPVEQLYDEATYSHLTTARTLFGPDTPTLKMEGANTAYGTAPKFTLDVVIGSGTASATSWKQSGVTLNSASAGLQTTALATVLPKGSAISIKNSHATLGSTSQMDGDWSIGTITGLVFVGMTADSVAKTDYAAATVQAMINAEIRMYDSMAARSSATTSNEASPPLHDNYRTHWVTITDQRPLIWSTPDLDMTTKSRVLRSPSGVEERGVVAGGSNAMTFKTDGTLIKMVTTSATVFTLSGTHADMPKFKEYLGYDNAGTETTQIMYVTLSGCSANSIINAEFPVVSITDTVLTVLAAESGTNAIPNVADPGVCVGNTVTFTSRMGGLIDSKAIAIHDRVKVRATTDTYETRTVDKVWGSNLDVTMFSVVDAYDTTDVANLENMDAWVDESGSTENVECSRRGLCDQESGQCACFPGYTSNDCGTQNALAS